MRYYYKDPMAAAWMAKHFGMKLKCSRPDGEAYDEEYNADEYMWAGSLQMYEKYGVHPDSLHLLEPQVGDLVLCEIDDFMHPDAEFQMVTYDPKLFDARHGIVRILYRKGVAFHYPESEAA